MALNVGELYASFGINSKGLEKDISSIEKKCSQIGKSLAIGGAAMTATVTNAFVKVAKSVFTSGTNFEAQMSKVESISGASGKSLDALTQKALEMGSTTQFTATEAGEALEYMAMAGWKDESMLAGLEPIMNLAAASGENLGTTSDIVTDAMTAMGYTLESVGGDTEAFNGQVTHFADVLAAAATSANTNVGLMGESFKYVAPLAGSLGYSIDDVAIALGTMANAGIKGGQAGTTLRQILQNLIKPTKEQSKAMERLGLDYMDANGNIKPLSELMGDMRNVAKESGVDIGELQKAVGDLDAQLESGEITEKEYNKAVQELTKGNAQFLADVTELAGARGLSGMLAIMNASDEEFEALTQSILHCDGATAKMAATMLDNAKGDVTIFKSALEGLSITLWTQVAPAFREIVQTATEYVDKFRTMDKGTQMAIIKMAGLAAAAGPVMTAMGGIVAFAGKLVPLLAGMVSPLGIVAAGLALFAVAAVDTNMKVSKTFRKMTKGAAKSLKAMNANLGKNMTAISKRMGTIAKYVRAGLADLVPAAVETIATVVTGLANAIGANASDILSIGTTIIEGVFEGLAGAAPGLISSLGNLFAGLATALTGAIPGLLGAAGDLGLKIVEGILTTDWLGLAGQVVDKISEAFGKSHDKAVEIGQKIIGLINENLTPENMTAMLTNATAFAGKLFGAITDAFSSTGEGGVNLVDGLVGAINGVLDTVTGDEFASNLGKLATAIINGVVNSLAALGTAGGDILTKIIDGITGILGNITGDSFGSIDTVATAIMTAIGNGLDTIGTAGSAIVKNVGGAIGRLLNRVTDKDFIGGAAKFAKKLIESLGTAIGKAYSSAGKIIDAIGTLLSKALSPENISGIMENLGSLGVTLISAIAGAIHNAAGGGATLLTAISNILTTALEGVNNLNIADTLTGLGESLMGAIASALENIKGDTTQLAGILGAIFGKAIRGAFELLQTIGGGVNDAIINLFTSSSFLSSLHTIAGVLVETLWSFVKEAITNIFDLNEIMNFIENQRSVPIETNITPEFNIDNANIDNAMRVFWGEITQMIASGATIDEVQARIEEWSVGSVGKVVFDKDQNFVDSLNALIQEQFGDGEPVEVDLPEVTFNADQLSEQLREQLGVSEGADGESVDLPVVGNLQVTEVTTGGDNGLQEAADAYLAQQIVNVNITAKASVNVEVADSNAATVAGAIGEDISESVLSSLYSSISGAVKAGGNFGQGFINGMDRKLAGIKAKALELARAAVESLKTGIAEGSPSKITMQSGIYFGEGFERGIASKIRDVSLQSGRMAASAVDALTVRAGSPKYEVDGGSTMRSGFGQMLGAMQQILTAMPNGQMQIVLDTGALVGATAPQYNQRLGDISRWRGGNHA